MDPIQEAKGLNFYSRAAERYAEVSLGERSRRHKRGWGNEEMYASESYAEFPPIPMITSELPKPSPMTLHIQTNDLRNLHISQPNQPASSPTMMSAWLTNVHKSATAIWTSVLPLFAVPVAVAPNKTSTSTVMTPTRPRPHVTLTSNSNFGSPARTHVLLTPAAATTASATSPDYVAFTDAYTLTSFTDHATVLSERRASIAFFNHEEISSEIPIQVARSQSQISTPTD
ncbi:hypothetical protein BT96DRAFT_1010223 [Gymnopus androsaceus JB14]|uniref:Uncharacterized protein n=1 Tax=Gymnopus androsaceus JB14 TaxID=1447944 RepID=A0A6A4GB08_9AGAR|nr:hypothetical protein BT96DRAFT_1010223 [Gymnopus androsaceus JB14]